MSRLAASSAANLANDLSHALDVSETTSAELLQRLEEAEAVIARVREVRDRMRPDPEGADDGGTPGMWELGFNDATNHWLALLDEVDGL